MVVIDNTMRFSLLTLSLGAICIATVMLMWSRREPWEVTTYAELFPPQFYTVASPVPRPNGYVSPDFTRRLRPPRKSMFPSFEDSAGIYVADFSSDPIQHSLTHSTLWTFWTPKGWGLASVYFADDTTLVAYYLRHPVEPGPGDEYPSLRITFSRRFPEWWWGHLYRPEVWLLPIWLSLIIWSIRKEYGLKAKRLSA